MPPNGKSSERPPTDIRRLAALLLAITLLLVHLAARWFGEESSGEFLQAASGRIGLVLLAL
jgi:hypothetical protein